MRLKTGFFSFTCCEGCIVTFLEVLNTKFSEYEKFLDIRHMRILRSSKKLGNLDIAFVEGAISTESEARKLREIRKKSKLVVALGSGAVNGFPSNQRNSFSEEKRHEIALLIKKLHQLKEISPLKRFVKVDDEIPGCPVSETDLMNKIDGYIKNAQAR